MFDPARVELRFVSGLIAELHDKGTLGYERWFFGWEYRRL
jgi:hypothetical protein